MSMSKQQEEEYFRVHKIQKLVHSYPIYANRLNMIHVQNTKFNIICITIQFTNLREREGGKSSGIMNEASLFKNLIVFSKVYYCLCFFVVSM